MLPDKFKKYNPELFANGKRGMIYIFKIKNKTFAVKIKNPNSKAHNRIQIEADFLKLLNKYKIGPKLIESSKEYLMYKFVPGITLREFLKENKLNNKLIDEILRQCKILDELRINKDEMHHPLKNIIIYKNKATLIDFERCKFTHRPKNINQFKEFLRRWM